MRGKTVKLNFISYEDNSGFVLKDLSVDVNKLKEFKELEREFFEASTAIDEEGRIRYLNFDMWSPALLSHLVNHPLISCIPGSYTVPELNLREATFKEVLEAVKDYYEKKPTIKTDQNTTNLWWSSFLTRKKIKILP